MQVEVLIRTEGRFFAVFQVVFAGGVFKHEISRSVRNPVVSLTGYRLSFRVEQSPFDRVVGFLSSELCDQITVFGFSLNVERSGQRGFGTGGFDPYQRSVFGRVGYEVFRSGNGVSTDLNLLQLTASRQARHANTSFFISEKI